MKYAIFNRREKKCILFLILEIFDFMKKEIKKAVNLVHFTHSQSGMEMLHRIRETQMMKTRTNKINGKIRDDEE